MTVAELLGLENPDLSPASDHAEEEIAEFAEFLTQALVEHFSETRDPALVALNLEEISEADIEAWIEEDEDLAFAELTSWIEAYQADDYFWNEVKSGLADDYPGLSDLAGEVVYQIALLIAAPALARIHLALNMPESDW